ncbi:MAG: hypothetical protein KH138_04695 [Firmicutes bacterium]|nr:hypothetical protein [Bacillota bacterium]
MTGIELIKIIADTHNNLVEIPVKGDSVILMGDALKNLRFLVQELQQHGIVEEEQEQTNAEV